MNGDVFTTRVPEVGFTAAGVPPPSPLYIGPGENLVVDTWSRWTIEPLTIVARVLTPAGQIHTTRYEHSPAALWNRSTTEWPLAEGHLLSVVVDSAGSNYRPGICFLTVGVKRGSGAAGIVGAQLIADYVTGITRLMWPGGRLISPYDGPGFPSVWPGTDPAPGTEIEWVLTDKVFILLLGVYFTLTTSATGQDRRVDLIIDHRYDTWIRWYIEAPAAQPAGVTRGYSYGCGFPSRAALGACHLCPLPADLRILKDWRVRTVTTNLRADDNFGQPIFTAQEWVSW